MKSETIKSIVIDAKKVLKSGDIQLKDQQNRILITNISRTLNMEFKKSPRTVAAIIKYIEDHGYQLTHMRCNETQRCLRNKEQVIEKIDPSDLGSIRMICESMFAQHISKKS